MNLSNEDYEKIKNEIKAELLKEITKVDFHNPHRNDSPFNRVRDKYTRCNSEFHQLFGNVTYAKVWEAIRYISVACIGERYTRNMKPSQAVKASEIAEYLIKYVMNKRQEVPEDKGE